MSSAPAPARSIRPRMTRRCLSRASGTRADIQSHAMMTEAVHKHGSLAGVELWHGGASVFNRTSRLAPLSPSATPWMATHVGFMSNLRPKVMDRADIRDMLRWQAEGARKARSAGFDIVYVYAGMGYLPYEFLLPEYNQRTDEYGGSVAGRVVALNTSHRSSRRWRPTSRNVRERLRSSCVCDGPRRMLRPVSPHASSESLERRRR